MNTMPQEPFRLHDVPQRSTSGLGVSAEALTSVQAYRCRFHLDNDLVPTKLFITAEGRYHAWLDGRYLGRGPTMHHPFEAIFDSIELSDTLAPGDHVLAVLLMDPGVPTLYHVPSEAVGVSAALPARDREGVWRDLLNEDAAWRVSSNTGFQNQVPRRTLVIDQIEHFVLSDAPIGWQEREFDDGSWATARTESPSKEIRETQANPLPPLRRTRRPAGSLHGTYGIEGPVDPLPIPAKETDTFGAPGLIVTASYGKALMGLAWDSHHPMVNVEQGDNHEVKIEGLSRSIASAATQTKGAGIALVFDLGQEYVGEPYLELDSDSAGVIDFGFAEAIDAEGRPQLMMKDGSYANRIETPGGRCRYEAIRYSGMRYLAVILREFEGSALIHDVGVMATEADLPWPTAMTGADSELTRLFDLCGRTLRLGAQETLVDCPTREQSTYVGDAHAMARWTWTLTGDARYWKRLVQAQFARPAPNGLIRTTVYSAGSQILLDYCLIAVLGTRDYFNATGDRDTLRSVLPAARGVLDWFTQRLNDQGFCAVDHDALPRQRAWETTYDPRQPTCDQMQILFIDHAGMGWHNLGQAGIDRRGLNAALQALLCLAEEALADLEVAVDEAPRAEVWRSRAAKRRLAAEVFFDPERQCYVDGIVDGKPVTAASQQTNVWAALAGWGGAERAAEVLRSRFVEGDAESAVCGPYFWIYAAHALKRAGMEQLMLEHVRKLWRPMLEQGATSLWETFAGDELDSRCHPWSAAPVDVVVHGLFGLPRVDDPAYASESCGIYDQEPTSDACVLRPWLVGLSDMTLACTTRHGKIEARWQSDADRSAGVLHLKGPAGLTIVVMNEGGQLVDSSQHRGVGGGMYRLEKASPASSVADLKS